MAGFDAGKYICNVVPSKGTERDFRAEHLLGARAAAAAPLPQAVDLRDKSWWRPGDQLSTGSCVGWAVADGVVRWHLSTKGVIPKGTRLSPRHIWMASKETDEFSSEATTFIESAGTSIKAAVAVARSQGVALEDEVPFIPEPLMYPGTEQEFYASCSARRVAAYVSLGKDLDQWRAWLAQHGPLAAALSVDRSWDEATDTGGNIDNFKADTVRGGHAVSVVGYRADGSFIVRNSWSEYWGDDGYGYVTPQYIADAFWEAYGVTA